MPKDLFSGHAQTYARYRPQYPAELFEYILQLVPARERAWDCATGNAQAAAVLSTFFQQVDASDISEKQLEQAPEIPNVTYHICTAEQTPFADHSFDLITVASAYHWLNWGAFYREACRVGKRGCVVAVWAYNLLSTDDEKVNELIQHFYHNIIDAYWEKERRFVDESYQSVDFDFDPLPSRSFEMELTWNREQLRGYLSSWSAVQTFIQQNGSDPLELIEKNLNALWKEEETRNIRFPLFLRIGKT